MPDYVVLNFEDRFGGGTQAAVAGSADAAQVGFASASGVADVYKGRAARKSTWLKKRSARFYPCVELIEADMAGQLTLQDVAPLRDDVRGAKTVVLVFHGDLKNTDHGYANKTGGNGQVQLCSWDRLARFLQLVMPDRARTYKIVLMMCFGGRSAGYRLDHDDSTALTPAELATSFAYKVYRAICRTRRVKMVAWTGKTSNESDVHAVCDNEAAVFEQIEKDDLHLIDLPANEAQVKAEMKRRAKALGISENDYYRDNIGKFTVDPNAAATTDEERWGKQNAKYWGKNVWLQKKWSALGAKQLPKYGKLVYEYDNGTLRITRRYPATAQGGANEVLYSGQLV